MTSIVELFPKCRKLAYDARQQLALTQQQQQQQPQQHQQRVGGGGGSGGGGVSELYMVLEELHRQLDCMDELVLRETPAQRTVWKRKIAEVRSEAVALSQQGGRHGTAAAGSVRGLNPNGSSGSGSNYYGNHALNNNNSNSDGTSYRAEREELMLRRRTRLAGEGDLQALAGESQSLASSHTMVLDIIAQGEQSHQVLRQQRHRLRGVTRVVADIGSSLGLSQATMRIIERRDITDAYFVAAGMIVTLLVLYLTWF